MCASAADGRSTQLLSQCPPFVVDGVEGDFEPFSQIWQLAGLLEACRCSAFRQPVVPGVLRGKVIGSVQQDRHLRAQAPEGASKSRCSALAALVAMTSRACSNKTAAAVSWPLGFRWPAVKYFGRGAARKAGNNDSVAML